MEDICVVCGAPITEAFKAVARARRKPEKQKDPVETCSSACSQTRYRREWRAKQREKKKKDE
jgi:hypothetical protein